MNYYIFRHAQTYFTKNHVMYEDKIETAKILKEGIPAITRLAKYLKNKKTDANFSSPYLRCKQTVEIVGKISGKEFVFDKRLGEFNAETIEEMADRLSKFYEEIKGKNYKNIAICTHGYPIAVLRSFITRDKFEEEELNSYPSPGFLMIIRNKKVEYINFN